MSIEYDRYLEQHKANVIKGYEWILDNLPVLNNPVTEMGINMFDQLANHDASKYTPEEYDAYDRYFYGNRSYQVVQEFNYAWLNHIHNNPHHWQYYVLVHDEPGEGITALDMPYNYILEMLCDWWTFSWKEGNLTEIFKWYDEHKDYMKLSIKTRKTVEDILEKIKEKLSELDEY